MCYIKILVIYIRTLCFFLQLSCNVENGLTNFSNVDEELLHRPYTVPDYSLGNTVSKQESKWWFVERDFTTTCTKFDICLSSRQYLSIIDSFSVISENITVYHTLSITTFFGLHFCCRLYGSNLIGPAATQFGRIMQIMAFTPFKVINFGVNGKPICNFLHVNNSNLSPILHSFQDMANYWSNFYASL